MTDIIRLAHGTLFPVTTELSLSPHLIDFLRRGGRSVLFGEHGDEYATGIMRAERIASETAARWSAVTAQVRQLAGPALIGLDADISAVHRLHRLTAQLPTLDEAVLMRDAEFEEQIFLMARDARSLGVNLLLSPTADVVAGENPWLRNRTLGDDIEQVSRLVAGYVRGVRRAGVCSTLKHFPSNPVISGMPATQDARVPLKMEALRPYLAPFRAGIDAGAQAVLMSPAIFDAIEPPRPGSISRDLIRMLRQDLGFSGLVITCDLDHRSTMGTASLEEIVIEALLAGADLLLVSPAAVPRLTALAEAIAGAVETGRLPLQRLEEAASAIDRAARQG